MYLTQMGRRIARAANVDPAVVLVARTWWSRSDRWRRSPRAGFGNRRADAGGRARRRKGQAARLFAHWHVVCRPCDVVRLTAVARLDRHRVRARREGRRVQVVEIGER